MLNYRSKRQVFLQLFKNLTSNFRPSDDLPILVMWSRLVCHHEIRSFPGSAGDCLATFCCFLEPSNASKIIGFRKKTVRNQNLLELSFKRFTDFHSHGISQFLTFSRNCQCDLRTSWTPELILSKPKNTSTPSTAMRPREMESATLSPLCFCTYSCTPTFTSENPLLKKKDMRTPIIGFGDIADKKNVTFRVFFVLEMPQPSHLTHSFNLRRRIRSLKECNAMKIEFGGGRLEKNWRGIEDKWVKMRLGEQGSVDSD